MNTSSYPSSTASTLQYMQAQLYMPLLNSPVTTTTYAATGATTTATTMSILPVNDYMPILTTQHNNTYYPCASDTELSVEESSMPVLLGTQGSASPTGYSPPMIESSKKETPQPQPQPPTLRKRTRATPEQQAVLEKTFRTNPTPSNRLRVQLSRDLRMPERSIQIWFQNRRAKVKNMAKRSSVLHNEIVRMQYHAAAAASAACQAASYHYQQIGAVEKAMATADLYYYYYYYYYNQQAQNRQYLPIIASSAATATPDNRSVPSPTSPLSNFAPRLPPLRPPPPIMADIWSTPPPPPPPPVSPHHHHHYPRFGKGALPPSMNISGSYLRAHSLGVYQPHRKGDTITAATMMAPVPTVYQQQREYRSRSIALPTVYWPNLSYIRQQEQEYPIQVPQPPTPPLDESLPAVFYTMASITTIELPAKALQIGSWGRMSMHPHDLLCHYNTQLRTMVWRIQSGFQQFKMEFNFDAILRMYLQPLSAAAEDEHLHHLDWARLELRLAQPEAILFYMKDPHSSSAGPGHWTQCSDFTQDNQAATVHVHHLDGPALPLRAAVHQLVQTDPHLQSVFVNDSQAGTMANGNNSGRSDMDIQPIRDAYSGIRNV